VEGIQGALVKFLFALAGISIAALALMIPGASLYFESGGGARCTSCHEMQPRYDLWHTSSHRGVGCEKCHGSALTLDPSFHRTNILRAVAHVRGDLPEQINFGNEHVTAMSEQCRTCHRQEYAAWQSGPHSATYSRIFLEQKHNSKHLLMDDCLRCHGMYFEGGVRDLVSPLDRTGPWRLARPELAEAASMPCLACHAIHREGPTLQKSAVDGSVAGPRQELVRPSLAFFDRRLQRHVPIAELPLPAMHEGVRPVKMSLDQRQALCYQCHAPIANMQVGSGDDRTGIGVHEGISCLACHAQHGQKTRASCASCHPKMSNCGLDVEKMDTTFSSPTSKHNVHWVKCADCHTKGVPRKQITRLETNR
jgi:hypothetical protein